MRYLLFVFCFALVLSLGIAAPVEAKGGKGGKGQGGGGHGGGQKSTDQQSVRQTGKGKQQEKHANKRSVENDNQDVDDLDEGRDHKSRKQTSSDTSNKNDKKHLKDQENDQEPLTQQERLLREQRKRDHKLAQSQHLRDIAERNGNQNLLAEADRMEAQANDRYAKQLEKFGLTDPALDPGNVTPSPPDGVTPTPPDGVTPTPPATVTSPLSPRRTTSNAGTFGRPLRPNMRPYRP
jgi:hypothetical protein